MKLLVIGSALALLIILPSCSKSDLNKEPKQLASPYAGYTTWLIKKDNHYPESGSFSKFNGTIIQFKALFDSSAVYQTKLPSNQNDINKLYGVADCGTHHHENSARFGWRWNGQTVEIFAYYYVNKERLSVKLGNAAIGQENSYVLSVEGNQYVFQYNEKETKVNRHCDSPAFDGYLLYPYFGGDETAPHDISIHISVLK
jgi:hypothetical protein